jgi:hypothetical protein
MPYPSLRTAVKQSSVLLFEEAFARCCWIASSLALLAMTRKGRRIRHCDCHVAASFVIANDSEAILRPPF